MDADIFILPDNIADHLPPTMKSLLAEHFKAKRQTLMEGFLTATGSDLEQAAQNKNTRALVHGCDRAIKQWTKQ